MENFTLPVLLIAALTDSINPCAISVLLITIAFLLSLGKSRLNIFLIGLAYILAIYISYLLIGLGILKALTFFNFPHIITTLGSIILIIYALIEIFNIYNPNFPIKLKIPEKSKPTIAKYIEKSSLPAAFLLGLLISVFEFPCTGGPYLFILSLLHSQETFLKGFLYLLLYNFIFISPLLLLLILVSNKFTLEKVENFRKQHFKKFRLILNFAIIILGIMILFFNFKNIFAVR